jgi:hypothetical protein
MVMAFAVALAMAAGVFAASGTDQSSVVLGLRLTSRWSFLLFWMAYAGGAIAALFRPALSFLAGRGREFGLAFASAHLVHMGLIGWLYWITNRPPLSGWLFVFFAIGAAWTYVLAALSFGRLAEVLGPKGSRLLRLVGMNYLLLAFGYDFVYRTVRSGLADQQIWHLVEYAPFTAMNVAAPLLTVAAAVLRHRTMRHATA